ncbi:MAG: sugar porter family MFS transporter [Planctomycetota bacterium]
MTLSKTLLMSSVAASLGGFLFGFDTVVISGAEEAIEALWGLSPVEHGFAMSAPLWGTVLGAVAGGWPSDRFGRKKTLESIGVLFLVSAVWSALAASFYGFMVARFLGGVGIGVATVASPLYISEIAPPGFRGRLTGMFQFNIVFGILAAYLSNALLGGAGEHAWRWMLGVEAAPALVYSLACLWIPESPRWLISERGDLEGAARVLERIDPEGGAAGAGRLAAEIQAADGSAGSHGGFWTARLRRPILLAFFVAFFNQLSGINAVLYFAPRIFKMTGLEENAALLQSVGIGVTNLLFTFAGLWLIDRAGRRTLLAVGSLGYIGSLGLCSWAFASGAYAIVPACIFAFIASHAVGQGAVIWVLISEVFPNHHRAAGQALGCSTHWVFAALLTLVFPKMVDLFDPSAVFAFFSGMMVLQLVWVLVAVPETKGVSLEALQERLGTG